MYPRFLRNLEECYCGFCSAAARHFTGRMNERKESIQKRIFFFLMELFLLMEVLSNEEKKKAFFLFCFPLKFNGGFMTRKREEASVR